MTNIIEEIAVKSASLPFELQHEVLDFVEFIATKKRPATPPVFHSVRGILKRELPNLENDLTEIRREMWRDFPREESE